MAEGRREFGGLVAAWHVTEIAGMFPGGSGADANELNPFKIPRPVSRAMQELLEWRQKRAMKGFAADVAKAARRKG